MSLDNYTKALTPQIQNHFAPKFKGEESVPTITTKHVSEIVPLTFYNKIFDVPFDAYLKEHSSEKWLARKALAIPQALYSGIVLSIYHLVTGIFCGVIGDEIGRDAQIFSFVRDLQEVIGRIVTVFNDTYGSYLTANAQIMKQFYQNKTSHSKTQNNPVVQRTLTLLEGAILRKLEASINLTGLNQPAPEGEVGIKRFRIVTRGQGLCLDLNLCVQRNENVTEVLSQTIRDRMISIKKSNLNFRDRTKNNTLQIDITPCEDKNKRIDLRATLIEGENGLEYLDSLVIRG